MVRRVAFAVPGDLATPTGGYGYDRRMIAELQNLGWQVDVVLLGDGFPRPSESQKAFADKTLAAVEGSHPVVIDGLALGVLPEAAAAVRAKRPLVALIHHPLALETGLSATDADAMRASERAALASASTVIVTSAPTARLLVQDYGVAGHCHHRCAAGHRTCARTARKPRWRRSFAFDRCAGAAQGLRRADRRAGDAHRSALAADHRRRPHAQSGGRGARRMPTSRGTSSAIACRCLARCRTAASTTLYGEADVFVLASRFEGYGMAYAEALAHGLPVIGTTGGATPETVPRDAGILVAPDDVTALAGALRRVISSKAERERMASAAWAAAAALPTWQESARLFAAAIEAAA